MTTRTARVGIGEPIPWFSAMEVGYDKNVAIDELAGRPLVLFLFRSLRDPTVSAALAAVEALGVYDDGRALCLAIGPEVSGVALEPSRSAGRLRLRDKGDVAGLFGLAEAGPVVLVLNPMLQIVDIAPVEDPGVLAARVESCVRHWLDEAEAPGSAPLLIVPNVFDRAFCKTLIALYQAAGGREVGAIESAGETIQRFDLEWRMRLDHYIKDEAMIAQCREQISRRLLPMIYRAFQFRTTRIERYLIGRYSSETGGYFRPHRDNTAPVVAHRRFAASIILNEDFDGGALTFPEFGRRAYRAKAGDALVFSCALLHEVTPITRGERYAFITFFYDEASQRLREDFTRSLAAASRS
ncbi:Predicted 2-oxoglutarate- and Fe(II)-dependent dioxygenase YbiX [Rhodoblastus acidophilus]|uniref:Predicted 2-oxoglutarate- and Fe(II)-dependent dioxygenase YbiX n=1 Tax=Rhodoblastus acidophilus TaxID=1074 RepID=A0A212S8S9_RHOAC|nr:2OG-Fe(II) oxygenase [Rhodoblastus acidophilus]PPQ36848.1 hypothetical protein CKO16_16705 [Rhodoblastus acidophilus]RAI21434.1 hypothetical protein CH337_07865 [Rhodoblastus acidophilus]SNB81793.1 Predicted 2-oxoglutarate- and Fe(II)-dependent dioxygenase YbiX [Rhodoblastus acidophilus]